MDDDKADFNIGISIYIYICLITLKNLNKLKIQIRESDQIKKKIQQCRIFFVRIAFGSKREKSYGEDFLNLFPAEACHINLGNMRGVRHCEFWNKEQKLCKNSAI
ncbi:hypothetical protein BpHYR1_027661 [Brachionus plicatilis]|uniref:Uncharacterized protein n=1 Tax=Brachionus plicatilis TaxID=10195 RepID=A0A3M7S3A2_BRAPC|nr:hypothetical protein BpHYR1_027661 [Brachionus plicatilis]